MAKKINLDAYKIPIKHYPLWVKKLIITVLIILLFLGITFIFLSLPIIKNKSAMDVLINKIKSSNFNAEDLAGLVLKSLAWILIVWGVSLKILETLLYRKKINKFMTENENPNNIERLKKMYTKKEALSAIKKIEANANNFLSQLKKACDVDNVELKGVAPFDIKEILTKSDLVRKEKILEIIDVLKNHGVDIKVAKNVAKSLKSVY